jgi:transposase
MAKLREDHVTIAREMAARQVPVRRIARQLGVDESTLRYRLQRPAGMPDGRRVRPSIVDGWAARIATIEARFGEAGCPVSVLYDVLVREFGFRGSYQAVRRYRRRQRGPTPVQAVRRVELPPGVQAQHDWFEFDATIAGTPQHLYGLIGTLAHSRASFVWVSPTMSALAWQTGHLALFARYGGVPLWVRIDNLKTAVASGAGPTGVLTPAFQVFARTVGFGVDLCRRATGSDKGKVERSVRTDRTVFADLFVTDWPTLPALQGAADRRAQEVLARRQCPATGTTVAQAWAAEQPLLQPLPTVHEPFDCVVARPVSRDGLVSFEGRRYSVPFAWIGRRVEVRGTADAVVIYGAGHVIARHPRGTARRLVLEPAHYEGPSTPTVRAPTPLGLRARLQLAGLPAPAALARPLTAYCQLIQEACR